MTDIEDPMFCFQCEQTAKGQGCNKLGICRKTPEVAALQDSLVQGVCAVSAYAAALDAKGTVVPADVGQFVLEAAFATLTNVSFDPAVFVGWVTQAVQHRAALKALLGESIAAADEYAPGAKLATIVADAKKWRIDLIFARLGKDLACLQQTLVGGLKGLAAYMVHAIELGADPAGPLKFVYRAFASLYEPAPALGDILGLCLECGKVNLEVMGLLDAGHTARFGNPEPTEVAWAKLPAQAVAGKAILVSGHDLVVLEALLKLTEGTGVNVFTHGEMLPANSYPGLKKYKSLAGHVGTAWQNQVVEFAAFPGPILLTTNCYIPAPDSYLSRMYGYGVVSGVGMTHIADVGGLGVLVDAALKLTGFVERTEEPAKLTIGFGHATVMSVAETVIGAVKSGALRRIFLIGGCDGTSAKRNYYTELAEKVPDDCLILTLACGKFKLNHRDYGTLGGLPRLLDMGQCNDAYSAIQVAAALAKVFECDLSSLPLSIVLSWFEQKAVVILLTLLHLGIKNMYVGPSVPAFFTPAILKRARGPGGLTLAQVLVDTYSLHVLGDPAEDLKTMLG